jgi:hypothetical protein
MCYIVSVNLIHGKEGKRMTNIAELQKVIDESELSNTEIAAGLGMSVPTFISRKKGESEFKASEIVKATILFGLTRERRDLIFLPDA